MPINNTSSLAGPFVPNGSTTIFPFAFNAQLPSDVAVFDGAGVAVSSALYTVALYEGDGGTVTFGTAPTLAAYPQLYIALVPSFAQSADFTNAGPSYNPAQLTAALDAISSRILALKGDVDRSLKAPLGEALTRIPAQASRAGKFLAFDAGGNPVAAGGTGPDASLRSDLAAFGGALLVAFRGGGVGAVVRTLWAKLMDLQVSPEDYGADPTGVISSVTAINAAATYLAGLGGGTIVGTGKYLIDANLILPDCVSLVGPWEQPDELLPGVAADYDGLRGQLIIAGSATVTTGDSCGIRGWIARRQGLDLPFANAGAATTGVAAFTGTAFTVGGAGSTFRNLLILGFNKAIYSTGFERVRIAYVSGDCTNGIEVYNCADISYVNFCHFWPWTTVHQSWTTNALLRRSGHAYLFANVGDWNMVSHCFSYGYQRGGRTASCDNMTWINCGADNTSTAGVGDNAGSIGFTAEGSSKSTRWIGLQAAAQADAYYVNVSAGNHVEMASCQGWACSGRDLLIDSGDVNVEGGEMRDTPIGVLVNSRTSRVFIDKVRFRNNSTNPIGFNTSNSTTFIGPNNDFSDTAAGSSPISNPNNWPIVAIASASAVNPPAVGQDFSITGTTNIATLNGGWKGRTVTLYFAGILTVTNGTGSTASIRLASGSNFTTAAGSTLTLRHNGTQWFEVGRAA